MRFVNTRLVYQIDVVRLGYAPSQITSQWLSESWATVEPRCMGTGPLGHEKHLDSNTDTQVRPCNVIVLGIIA